MAIRNLIYVRPTGNDSTGTGTSGAPYRTVQKALSTIPVNATSGTRYVIDATGINDTGQAIIVPPFQCSDPMVANASPPLSPAFTDEGYVTIQATPTVLDTLNAGTTSAVADSVTSLSTVTDTSKSWTTDAYKGKFIVGSGAGQFGVITHNTNHDLVVTTFYGPTGVAFTAPIKIVDCGASLAGTGSVPPLTLDSVKAKVVLQGISISSPALGTGSIEGTAFDFLETTLCSLGSPRFNSGQQWAANGCYVHGANSGVTTDSLFIVARQDVTFCYFLNLTPSAGGSNLNFEYCTLENCWPFDGPALLTYSLSQFLTQGIIFGGPSAGELLDVRIDNVVGIAHVNPNGSAICIWGGARVNFLEGGVSGSGNAGYGVEVAGQGVGILEAGEAVTFTVTGTLGNLKVGDRPVRTWSSFTTGAPLLNEVDYSQLARLGNNMQGGVAAPDNGWANVRNFGAKGDVVVDVTTGAILSGTDDSAAFAAAAASVGKGGVVYVPPGNYRWATTWSMAPTGFSLTDAKLVGCGAGSRIYPTTGSGVDACTVGAWGRFSVEDLVFVGNGLSDSVTDCNCLFNNPLTSQADEIAFRRCTFYGVMGHGSSELACALIWSNAIISVLEDVKFYGCAWPDIGYVFAANGGVDARNLLAIDYGEFEGREYSKSPGGAVAWFAALDSYGFGATGTRIQRWRDIRCDEAANKHLYFNVKTVGETFDEIIIENYQGMPAMTGIAGASIEINNAKRVNIRGGSVKCRTPSPPTPTGQPQLIFMNAGDITIEDVEMRIVDDPPYIGPGTLGIIAADGLCKSLKIINSRFDKIIGWNSAGIVQRIVLDQSDIKQAPQFSAALRPAANAVPPYAPVFNLDVGAFQYSDGALWHNIGGVTPPVHLTDGTHISTNGALGKIFNLWLNGTGHTLDNPTNISPGETYVWFVKQSPSGTLLYGSLFSFPHGTAPTLTTGAGAVDMIVGVYDGISIHCTVTPDVGSGALTNPTTISGCVGWWRADLGVTLTLGKVSAWANQAGGTVFGAATQPTAGLQPTPGTGLNGKAKFVMAASALELASTLSGAQTVIAVATTNPALSGGTGTRLVAWKKTGSTLAADYCLINAAGWGPVSFISDVDTSGGAVPFIGATTPFDANGHVYAFTYNGLGNGVPANYQFLLDGVAQTLAATSSSYNAAGVVLGGVGAEIDGSHAAVGGFTGDYYELIIFNRVLTAIELLRVRDYLNTRYSI